jgi:uncharacterized protein YuzE
MDIRIDELANAAYVRVATGKVFKTAEEGEFTVDYSLTGRVLGVEILGLKQHRERHGGMIRIPSRYTASMLAKTG